MSYDGSDFQQVALTAVYYLAHHKFNKSTFLPLQRLLWKKRGEGCRTGLNNVRLSVN